MSLVRPIPRKPFLSSPIRDCRKRVLNDVESEEDSSSYSLKKRLISSPNLSSLSLKKISDSPQKKNSPNMSPRLRSALESLSSYDPTLQKLNNNNHNNRSNHKLSSSTYNKNRTTTPTTNEIHGKDEIRNSPQNSFRRASSSCSPNEQQQLLQSSLSSSPIDISAFKKTEKISSSSLKKDLSNSSLTKHRSIIKRPQKKNVQVIFNNISPPKKLSSLTSPPSLSSSSFLYPIVLQSSPPPPTIISPSSCCILPTNHQSVGYFIVPTNLSSISSPSCCPPLINTTATLNYPNSITATSIEPSPPREILINTTTPITNPNLQKRLETEAKIIKEYQKLMELKAQELMFRNMQKQLEASLVQMNQTQVVITSSDCNLPPADCNLPPAECNLQER